MISKSLAEKENHQINPILLSEVKNIPHAERLIVVLKIQ